jgi:hypothetical protein
VNNVRVVHQNQSAVEWALRSGNVRCPGCQGPLRPWGRARPRPIRLGASGDRLVRPRRARCAACRATHVLLPDWMVARRAYSAAVIWAVLAARARGLGYRQIAHSNGLPETTVRDWLRDLRRSPSHVFSPPAAPRHTARPAATGVAERCARALSGWLLAVHATRGRRPANTSPPPVRPCQPANRPP